MKFKMENFSHDGNIPEAKDRLHIHAKGGLIVFAHALNISVGISSYLKAM